jgi:Alternative oxidase
VLTRNSSLRISADELKRLLHKHNTAFTEEEVHEIGELFYAGKAGQSVSFDRFIEAIDYVAHNEQGKTKEASEHFKDGERHPLGVGRCAAEYMMTSKSHGFYTPEELDVKLTHLEPVGFRDHLAYNIVKAVRFVFDSATGWRNDNITAHNILNRVIYLETVAAVPGMVAAIVRHFRSLRTMERDGGMLQMFLEEANNERMQ